MNNMFPIVSPNASIIDLKNDYCLITNLITFKTVVLNKYQTFM